jgi:hypothetical protein
VKDEYGGGVRNTRGRDEKLAQLHWEKLTGSGTQPLIQWVPGAVSSWKSGRGMKLTTYFHLVRGQEWWSYTSTLPYVFMAWYLIKP